MLNGRSAFEQIEYKSLKNELEMYKEFTTRQTDEINNFKIYTDENAVSLREFQSRSKELYEIQCMNFKSCVDLLKVFLYTTNYSYTFRTSI